MPNDPAHAMTDRDTVARALREAAVFMLELVDQYYGTDHEFDIPEEAEFRRHRAVIEAGSNGIEREAAALRPVDGGLDVEQACPICGSLFSHDHCSECSAKNAMPWTHVETCSHYRPSSEFDTPAARQFEAALRPVDGGLDPVGTKSGVVSSDLVVRPVDGGLRHTHEGMWCAACVRHGAEVASESLAALRPLDGGLDALLRDARNALQQEHMRSPRHAPDGRGLAADCQVCVVIARLDYPEYDRIAALAAQPAAGEGLDVERLGKAICATLGPVVDGDSVFVDDECRARANEVAAEYARLRAAAVAGEETA